MKLINGDCLEYLKQIPDKSIDMILQDPPYNTTACAWEWDIMTKIDEFWSEWNRIIKQNGAIVMFGSEPFSSALRMSNIKNYKYDLVWKKQKPVNFLQLKRRFGKTTENIVIFYNKQCTYNPQKYKIQDSKKVKNKVGEGKGNSITSAIGFKAKSYEDDGTRYPTDILEFKRVDERKIIHPTQKPVALMEYLIKTYTQEGEVVFDGFMGSGTTGVACKNLNRDFIGIELNKEYFEVAKNRIESLT